MTLSSRNPDGSLKTYAEMVTEAGPCRLGGTHTKPGFNVMVYCEHGLSVWACTACAGQPDDYDPSCDQCGKPKNTHTETEALYCIRRSVVSLSDRNIYMTGGPVLDGMLRVKPCDCNRGPHEGPCRQEDG